MHKLTVALFCLLIPNLFIIASSAALTAEKIEEFELQYMPFNHLTFLDDSIPNYLSWGDSVNCPDGYHVLSKQSRQAVNACIKQPELANFFYARDKGALVKIGKEHLLIDIKKGRQTDYGKIQLLQLNLTTGAFDVGPWIKLQARKAKKDEFVQFELLKLLPGKDLSIRYLASFFKCSEPAGFCNTTTEVWNYNLSSESFTKWGELPGSPLWWPSRELTLHPEESAFESKILLFEPSANGDITLRMHEIQSGKILWTSQTVDIESKCSALEPFLVCSLDGGKFLTIDMKSGQQHVSYAPLKSQFVRNFQTDGIPYGFFVTFNSQGHRSSLQLMNYVTNKKTIYRQGNPLYDNSHMDWKSGLPMIYTGNGKAEVQSGGGYPALYDAFTGELVGDYPSHMLGCEHPQYLGGKDLSYLQCQTQVSTFMWKFTRYKLLPN